MKKNLWMLVLIAGFGLSGMKVFADGAYDASQQNNDPTGGGWGGPSSSSSSGSSGSSSSSYDDKTLNEDDESMSTGAQIAVGGVLGGLPASLVTSLLKNQQNELENVFQTFEPGDQKNISFLQTSEKKNKNLFKILIISTTKPYLHSKVA